MKKSKKSVRKPEAKLTKKIESSLSKRAETLIYDEIKKSIIGNPALFNQLTQAESPSGKANIDISD